jgi:hypothetical protein
MKIKLSFVTNSSSTSFVFLSQKKILKKDIEKKFRKHILCLDTFKLKDKKNLIEYIQSGEYDFLNDIMGPREYYALSRETYIQLIHYKSKESFVNFLSVNRNSIEDTYESYIKEIISDSDIQTIILEVSGG